ncbi:MAG: type II secretion system protein GspG [Acidobacteriota bacterium]
MTLDKWGRPVPDGPTTPVPVQLQAAQGQSQVTRVTPREPLKPGTYLLAVLVDGQDGARTEHYMVWVPEAAPHLVSAEHERAWQTMRDIRTMATGIEAYGVDHDGYPSAGDLRSLTPLIHPTYIRSVPENDAWGRPFECSSGKGTYEIRSLGADGHRDTGAPEGPVDSFTPDLVFRDGTFQQWPKVLEGLV